MNSIGKVADTKCTVCTAAVCKVNIQVFVGFVANCVHANQNYYIIYNHDAFNRFSYRDLKYFAQILYWFTSRFYLMIRVFKQKVYTSLCTFMVRPAAIS